MSLTRLNVKDVVKQANKTIKRHARIVKVCMTAWCYGAERSRYW